MYTTNGFKAFAYERHDVEVNQKYDESGLKLPYSCHLHFVSKQAEKFAYLLTHEEWVVAEPSTPGHDLIEDARLTYNDIKEKAGERVAEVIYLCSEFKGRNRAERHSNQFYTELSQDEIAVFVKHCDILGNVLYGILTNSGMVDKYIAEFPKFRQYCYQGRFDDMFTYTELVFKLHTGLKLLKRHL